MKKFMKMMMCMMAMVLILSGCQSVSGTDTEATVQTTNEPQIGGTYVMLSNGDPISFNPNLKTDDMALPAVYNLFNRLVKSTVDNSIVPDLATSWQFSEDGHAITFWLREDVSWHDGEPFNAEDVVWTFEKILSDGYQSGTLSNVKSIEAQGDYEVTFHLKTADASILSALSWLGVWIMPEHLYNDGSDWTQNPYNMNPIGTGPFKFVDYVNGSSITMTRNEDYFDGAPYIETLIVSIIPDAATAYQAYLAGEIDDIQGRTPTANLPELIDDTENFRTYTYMGTARTYLSFNLNDDNPFGDVRVRQAVNLAVDRQGIVDKAAKGFGAPSEYYISPMFAWALNDNAKVPAQDIEAAKKLLEEAGYTQNSQGMYFSCTLTTFDSGDYKDTAMVVQDSLKQIGIDCRVEVLEIGAFMSKVIDNYDFDIAMNAGGQGPDISAIRNRIHSNGSLNLSRYSNPDLDEALDSGITVFEEADRKVYYDQVQEIMAEELPIVVLKDSINTYPVKATIHNHPFETEMASLYGSYEMVKVWMEQ